MPRCHCKNKKPKHIKDFHPEKINFNDDDWYLEKPNMTSKPKPEQNTEPISPNSISNTALKTVIEEEFDNNFSCFICYEVSSGDNYQLTCCSKYMCANCFNENQRINGYHTACPHCRSDDMDYQCISRLKYVLDDVRDNLVRNVISKLEENGGNAANVDNAVNKNLRTIFARNFPQGTTIENIENLAPFGKAIKTSLPWNREDRQIRGFAFIEFSSEQDCLDALLASKQLMFKGVKIQTRQSKPNNKEKK